jgi:hypothetical protein
MLRRTLADELVIRILQTFHDHQSMWTLVVAVLLVLAAAQLGGLASGVDRPHIVLILVDDMVSYSILLVLSKSKSIFFDSFHQILLVYIFNLHSGSLVIPK